MRPRSICRSRILDNQDGEVSIGKTSLMAMVINVAIIGMIEIVLMLMGSP